MKTQRLDPWIEGYLDYLKGVRRLAPRGLVDKRCTLKKVGEVMARLRPGKALWQLAQVDYIQWVNHQREAGYSTASIAKDLSHLRGLLDYAWRSGRSTCNVLDGFHLQDGPKPRVPRSLSLEQARRLVNACGSKTALQRRDRLIILLLYGCGLRTGELHALNLTDVDLERQEVVVRKGKGDRARRIPVADAVWTPLLAYLAERRGRFGALFRTEQKRVRLPMKDIGEVVRAAGRAAGLEVPVTPKTLRHTFATHLMDRGVDVAVIATLMGHRSAQETGVYLHRLPGRRQAAVQLLNRKKP